MAQSGSGSFWETIRAWADSAGLLLPAEPGSGPRQPTVPKSVCDNCPICQAAATLDEVNPQVVEEMVVMARNVLAGLGSALASAADQRGPVVPGESVPGPPPAPSADEQAPAAEDRPAGESSDGEEPA